MEFFLSTANRGEINHSVFLGPGGGFGAKEISPPPPLFQRFSISRFNFPRPSTPFSRPLSNPHPLSRPHATAKKKQRVLNFNLWYFFFPIPEKEKKYRCHSCTHLAAILSSLEIFDRLPGYAGKERRKKS